MKNLAGVKEADEHIQEELYLAGIKLVRGKQSEGEVPYSITGKLGDWNFNRAWYYWMASAPEEKGLPLEVATELHEMPYPIIGEKQPKNYGQVIRVEGHCGCPPPKEWANHFDDKGNQIMIDANGEQEKLNKEFFESHSQFLENPDFQKFKRMIYVPNLDRIVTNSFVNLYHIDNQLGLNEFAKVLRKL